MKNNHKQLFTADWMEPDKLNLRLKAPEYLNAAIEQGIFDSPVLSAEPFSSGIDSAAYKVTTENGPIVLKMAAAQKLIAEVTFLNACSERGIQVPSVIKYCDSIDSLPVPLTLMQYIDAPLLSESSADDMIAEGSLREMGILLARIHQIKGAGFGEIVDSLEASYPSQREYLSDGLGLFGKAKSLCDKGIIGDVEPDISQAVSRLDQDASKIGPSLLHYDLMPYNTFRTSPLTVFDPNAKLMHPYLDLATTLLKSSTKAKGDEMMAEVSIGYNEVSTINKELLRDAMLIRGVLLINYLGKKASNDRIKKLKELLSI